MDVFARYTREHTAGSMLSAAFVGDVIFGTTESAPSVDVTEHAARQIDADLRGAVDVGSAGSEVDAARANCGQNADDDAQDALLGNLTGESDIMAPRQAPVAQLAHTPTNTSDRGLLSVKNECIAGWCDV